MAAREAVADTGRPAEESLPRQSPGARRLTDEPAHRSGADSARAAESAPLPSGGLSRILGLTRRPRQLHGDTRGYMLRRWLVLADVIALTLAFLAVESVGGFDGGTTRSVSFDLALLAVATPIWILLLRAYGLYHVYSRRADHGMAEEVAPLFQMTTVWSWSVLLIASLTGLRQIPLPKLVLFWLLAFVLLLFFRAGVRAWSSRRTWYIQNTLVIGTPAESAGIATKILRHPEYGVNIVACLELTGEGHELGRAGLEDSDVVRTLGPIPLIRGQVDVVEVVRELDVDRVLLAPSVNSLGERSDLLSDLSELAVHLDLMPGWGEVVGSRLEMTEMEGVPLLTLPRATIPRSSLVFKRVLDLTVSAGLLLVLSPLLALCAAAIKLDSRGPVLYRQRRVGMGGRRFELLKFRSMSDGAEARREELAELTLHGTGTGQGIFKVADDPRVTRVGRLMRRLSLDELPQLANILRGDMSLVGPRPLPEAEHERIDGRYRRRVDLMPGLTGLWQVHGRSNIPFEGMVGLDYLYVTNWSLWRDIKLLIRTIRVVARGSGAY